VRHIHGEARRPGGGPSVFQIRSQNGGSAAFDAPYEIAPSTPRQERAVGLKATSEPIISNEQASCALSLFATVLVIVATNVAAGSAYAVFGRQEFDSIGNSFSTGVVLALIFCGVLRFSEERQPMKISHANGRARRAAIAWLMTFAVFLAIAFTLKLGAELSRGAIISSFLVGLVTVPLSHMNAPILLARLRKQGAFVRRDIIVMGAQGDPSLARLVAEFVQGGCPAPHVVEFDAACGAIEWPHERKALLNAAIALAHRLGPGEIYLSLARVPQARAESILRSLTLVPRAISVVPDEFTSEFLRHGLSEVGNRIAADVQKAPLSGFGRVTKRVMDVVLSSILIVFFLPLFVGISAAILWDSPGPVLFRQARNGYRGRAFRILKFRTMSVMEDGEVIKQASKNDQRVTAVGRWLRKLSLDEIPQLFNVLSGEMSLIGPRPHAKAHDVFYSKLIENYEIRQHVKPGITGWAQVNGLRGETQTLDLMYRRIEFDCWYAKNCSVFLDLNILARTVLEVLRPRNAY